MPVVTVLWSMVKWIARSRVASGFVLFNLVIAALYGILGDLFPQGWLTALATEWGNIPSGVLFFLYYASAGEGLGLVFSAWVIRFTIRRIPVIG